MWLALGGDASLVVEVVTVRVVTIKPFVWTRLPDFTGSIMLMCVQVGVWRCLAKVFATPHVWWHVLLLDF